MYKKGGISLEFTIRRMEIRDIKTVQEVAKISWHATYAGIIPLAVQDQFLKVAYSNLMMERRLSHSLIWVAEADGKLVGFAHFSPVKDGECELSAIYLLPDYQGNGIGSALLKIGLKELEGIEKLYINVEKENRIGKTFYEAKGFHVVEEFDEDFEGHLLKTVKMVLNV